MLALSIRQPYAELILRGMKTIEYRSRSTRMIGERFWIYASLGRGAKGVRSVGKAASPTKAASQADVYSTDLAVVATLPWMVELANAMRLFPGDLLNGLPRGVIVGSAVIEKVSQRDDGMYQWHLAGARRAKRLRKPAGHPQPVWFRAL